MNNAKLNCRRWPVVLWLAAAIVACELPAVRAADFIGASQIVVRAKEALATPAGAADDRVRALADDLSALRTGWTNMTPEAAVARWLELADRFSEVRSAAINDPSPASYINVLEESEGDLTGTVTHEELFNALPGPATWNELRTQVERIKAATPVEQKRKLALTLLALLLVDDRAAFDAAIKDGEARFRKISDSSVYDVKNILEQLRRGAIQRNLRSPAEAVHAFRQLIDMPMDSNAGAVRVQVPDLVGIVGEKDARALLEKAIGRPCLKLYVPGGGRTRSLLKEIVAANIEKLKRPQWSLIDSRADIALFEAMDRRFPVQGAEENARDATVILSNYDSAGVAGQDYERRPALGFYILGLIESGRVNDAVAATIKAGETEDSEIDFDRDVKFLTDSNTVGRLAEYCEGVLVKRSVNSLWSLYVSFAYRAGRGETALKLLQERMADPATGPELLVTLQNTYITALLAMDRVDDAVLFCREAIKTRKAPVPEYTGERLDIPLRLIQLGRLLGRKDWVAEGGAAMLQTATAGVQVIEYILSYAERDALFAFKETGRLADVETLAVGVLSKQARENQQTMVPAGCLGGLAVLYDAAGRPADVMALLSQAPWWGAEDVADLTEPPVQPAVLRALVATGHTQEAARFARLVLAAHPDNDDIYAVLVDLEGVRCLPFLEALHLRDRFEERPLIWKAEVLRRAGQFVEAEAAARAALQIDPTDGEQGTGDRVLAYRVLASILEAGGKAEDAAFFNKVVESVRTAEEGDKFTSLGLIGRSIPLYEKAEVLFGDAYCVQWRLAERLQTMGRSAEAEKHYAIAFERMPEQFGRVASFCFGCEGAFQSGASRSAAERVLTGLVGKEPVRPQVYYLMGLLRDAQERRSEAADYFKKALEKDPEYFDAMRSLHELAGVVFMTQDERNRLEVRMLELDPLQRHGGSYTHGISDFKTLWELLGRAQRLRMPMEGGIYPLAASKAHLAATINSVQLQMGYSRPSSRATSGDPSVPTFGEVLVQHELTREIVQMFQQ